METLIPHPSIRDFSGVKREGTYITMEVDSIREKTRDAWIESSDEQYWWYDGLRICPVGAYSMVTTQHRCLEQNGHRIPAYFLKMSYVACIREIEKLQYVKQHRDADNDPYVLSRIAWLEERIAQFKTIAMLEDVALPTISSELN